MNKPKCLNCLIRSATDIKPFGFTYCKKCLATHKKLNISDTVEIITLEMKKQRKQYSKEIMQKYEQGDTVNKDYIDLYGSKGLTKQQIKNAKPSITKYYKT